VSSLPVFDQRSDCRACKLGDPERICCIGMPTRIWDGGHTDGATRALLLVGSHPMVAEDNAGVSFVGPTGEHTNGTYVRGGRLSDFADCYLTNAVRCCPRDGDVTNSHVKACRGHLIADVQLLGEHYDEVVILAMGEKAVTSVLGNKNALRTFPQGSLGDIGGVRCRVFATWLGTNLLPGRDPSKIWSIRDHLLLVWRYLKDGRLTTKVRVPRAERLVGGAAPDPPANTKLVALDIETYGCLDGFPDQRVFHPRKSTCHDRVHGGDLVVSVALAWRGPDSGAIQSKVYRMWRGDDREKLLSSLRGIQSLAILNQNVAFDVQYLWAFDRRFREVINPRTTRLVELQVVNFLENDQRIERSLKTLSRIIGVANYQTEKVSLKDGERYASREDPDLWRYNAKDVLATLLCYEELLEGISIKYPNTDKWTSECQQWFSDLVWECILMEDAGIRYDERKLARLDSILMGKLDRLLVHGKSAFDVPVIGPGSDTAKRREVQRLFDEWTPDPSTEKGRQFAHRVEYTKKGKLSIGMENLNLLRGVIPPGHVDRLLINVLHYAKRWQKITGTYTGPLLGLRDDKDDKVATRLVDKRMAYPRWYPIPMSFDKSDRDFGGTQQCRITSKDPATQTQPPMVEGCQRSRWPRGNIVRADAAQLELRVATMWSGDSGFLRIFAENLNAHLETAQLLGRLVGVHDITKATHPKWYHAGKTLNFLMLFLGGWYKFQETVLKEVDLFIPDQACQQIIETFNSEHPEQRAWQQANIEFARTNGFLAMPISGLSRSFCGDIDASYIPMIANFPVQALAAMLVQSAQVALRHWLWYQGLSRCIIVANTYDEIVVDCPNAKDARRVARKCLELLRVPPIYEDLIGRYGLYRVPLDAEAEIVYNRGHVEKVKA
jgi:uracil-DNA glycosylase family 4